MQASSEGRNAVRTMPFDRVGFPRPSLVKVSEPRFVQPVNVQAELSTLPSFEYVPIRMAAEASTAARTAGIQENLWKNSKSGDMSALQGFHSFPSRKRTAHLSFVHNKLLRFGGTKPKNRAPIYSQRPTWGRKVDLGDFESKLHSEILEHRTLVAVGRSGNMAR